jgi:hypothetical protein
MLINLLLHDHQAAGEDAQRAHVAQSLVERMRAGEIGEQDRAGVRNRLAPWRLLRGRKLGFGGGLGHRGAEDAQ